METWLLRFNIGKYNAIGDRELRTNYSITGVTVENMTDLGVIFDNKLKFDKQIIKLTQHIRC